MQKKENKKPMPYIALYVMVFIYSLGGICSKLAASKKFLSFEWAFFYGLLLLSLAIYAVTWQQILKKIPLNTAYTVKSLGLIWTMLWGVLIFHEKLNFMHLISAVLIIAGVILMTTSGRQQEGAESNE